MYENVTAEGILNSMLTRVSDKLDKREGSVIADSLSPAALEIMALYIELERVIKEGFGDTASREFLILRCKERGISPYPAEKAVGRGVFSPKNLDVTGKRFSIGEVNFTAVHKLSDGVYRMECETAGKIGNRFFGNMIPIDYIDGLEKAELTEIIIPGEDEEDTEDLRKRYFASFEERSFGGNVSDYIGKTNRIAGVGSTKVTSCWNGDIKPALLVPDLETDSWVGGILSSPAVSDTVKEWLSAVYKAARDEKLTVGGAVQLTVLNSDFDPPSEELIRKVKEETDPAAYSGEGLGFAPIGHIVRVRGAEGASVNVKTNITFEEGYSFDNIKDRIDRAVSDYLLELRRQWADSSELVVRISQIETRLLAVSGIADISDTVLNGKSDNLVLSKDQVPVFGSISEL